MSVAEAKRWNKVLGDFIELKESGRQWIAAMSAHRRLNRESEVFAASLDRCMDTAKNLETIFRRILA